jgi:hypothetical protein
MRKGECFANANRVIKHFPNAKIVHGTIDVISVKTGRIKRGSHAWLEMNDSVVDPTYSLITNRKTYYKAVKAKPKKKYTHEQVLINCLKFGHHGPWVIRKSKHKQTR